MHCNVCPYWPHVRIFLPYPYCGDEDPPNDGINLSREELGEKCMACHKKAQRRDRHLSYDNDGGKLHGEISFDDHLFAPGTEQGDFTTAPEYLGRLRRDSSDGCTTLPPGVEDALRKAAAEAVSKVNVRDAPVFLSLLKREPLALARKQTRKTHSRREFVEAVRRSLDIIDDVKTRVCMGDNAKESRRALGKLVKALGEMLTPFDAPILVGMMQGMSLADTARVAGLNSRSTAHARARDMLERLPQLKTLHGLATSKPLASIKERESRSGSAFCGEIDSLALPRR